MVMGEKNSGDKWRICDEGMELLEVFKYFGMWFDQHGVGKSAFGKLTVHVEGKDSTHRKAEGW